MIRKSNTWIVALVLVWAAIALPYVAVGADDVEEYFTSVTTTRMAIDAIFHGSWPFWNLDLGLGMPQPLRFHFITHPLSPLCGVTDCHALLRSIASLHVLLGAMFMAWLAARFSGSRLLALAAGLTYCLSSSVVQPMLTDDWPITALNESALPVMLYAVLAIGDADGRRKTLLWTLILGGSAGLLLSMSFPVLRLVVIAIVALSAPGLRQRLPWLVLAAAITLLMGGAQVHHIYEEFVRTPSIVTRSDHNDFPLAAHLWSAFARPLPLYDADPKRWWRTVFFGPVFAVAAALGALTLRDRDSRPLRVGLLLGLLGFIVPPAWLFNINTAQWTFRTDLNVFGILLAVVAIHRWSSAPGRERWTRLCVVAQLSAVVAAFVPTWYDIVAASVGLAPPGRERLLSPGIAEEIAALYAVKPGRVMFAEKAYEALRRPVLMSAGLAPNQLSLLGVPTVTAVAFGITTDDLYPLGGMLEGEIKGDAAAVQSPALLNVLGVRYVIALADEPVAPGLRQLRRLQRDVRLYENLDAWPEAFFVETMPTDRVPRIPTCAHGRFLCADFSRYDLRRRTDPLEVTRLHDGLHLTFAPSDSARHIVVSQWYRAGWTVTEGRASISRAAEQLVGVHVDPGQHAVTVRFRPRLRALLFATGVTTELVVAVAILALMFGSSRQGTTP